MKRFMAVATALSLMTAASALAADPPDHGHAGPPPAGDGHSGGHGGGHGGAPHAAPGGGHAAPAGPHAGGSGGPYAYVTPGRNDTPHPQGAADRPRYDPQHFPRQLRAKQRFEWKGAGAWNNQPGWYAHHWGYGDYLPQGWFAADFWINDYEDYDLPAPPYGYEWVRSGPDALLVDVYTGEVVEAVYGVF